MNEAAARAARAPPRRARLRRARGRGHDGRVPDAHRRREDRLLAAVVERGRRGRTGDRGTGSNDTRHSRSSPRAAPRPAPTQRWSSRPTTTSPARPACAPTSSGRGGGSDRRWSIYNIPSRVVINLEPDLLAELAEIENVVAVKQANDDELGPIEGLAVLAGNDDNLLRVRSRSAAPGVSSSPPTSSASGCGRCARRRGRGHRARPGDRRRLQDVYERCSSPPTRSRSRPR